MRGLKHLKGIIALLLAVAFIIPTGYKAEAASYKTGIYKINTQSTPLNIRSCYGSDYMKVGEVPKGTKVNVTFVSSNGWGKIVYGSAHGWISLEYCKYVGPYEESQSTEKTSAKSKDPETCLRKDWMRIRPYPEHKRRPIHVPDPRKTASGHQLRPAGYAVGTISPVS